MFDVGPVVGREHVVRPVLERRLQECLEKHKALWERKGRRGPKPKSHRRDWQWQALAKRWAKLRVDFNGCTGEDPASGFGVWNGEDWGIYGRFRKSMADLAQDREKERRRREQRIYQMINRHRYADWWREYNRQRSLGKRIRNMMIPQLFKPSYSGRKHFGMRPSPKSKRFGPVAYDPFGNRINWQARMLEGERIMGNLPPAPIPEDS